MELSAQSLHYFLNYTPTVLFEYLHHLDGSVEALYISPTSKAILGYPPEHFLEDTHNFWKILHPDDRARFRKEHDAAVTNSDFFTSEARIIGPSGKIKWIRLRSKLACRSQEGTSIWSGCVVDITQFKQAVEKLRASEQRYKGLAELLPEALFEADIDANLTYANPCAFKISGYTKKDFDNGLNGIDLLVPEDRERARKNLARRFKGENIGAQEYIAMKKDGTIFPVLLHSAPTFNQTGTIIGVRGIIVDISERKKAEEELNRYRYHLEELVNARTNQLEQKTAQLEETNIALTVLLEQREKDKKVIEEDIRHSIENLVLPYLEKLKEAISRPEGKAYLEIMASNLKEMTARFSPDLFGQLSKLTPTEMEIADLIRRGKSTKEIAQLMNLSPTTVATHRQNIRKKLLISNKKMNLRTFLGRKTN